jgi:outer membrane lipoprotein-sorting protein
MRKWTGLSAGVLMLIATISGAAAAQTAPAAAPAPLTVDEIVAKHILTKGGAEKWKTIQSQRMTGVASAQGFELAMTVYGKRPNLSRQELKLEVPGQPVVTIVTLFDGTKAWMINPTSGSDAPQEAPQPETATAKVQADFDGPLLDYKAKGFTVELLAPLAVGGKQAHHLRVSRADVPTQHYYLDPESFVELKITVEGPNASDSELSDYRAVEGIMVPHAVKILQNGVVQADLRILKVEFNVPMEDALFRVK